MIKMGDDNHFADVSKMVAEELYPGGQKTYLNGSIKHNGISMNITQLQNELQKLADKRYAAFVQGYFKTGKGEYGEGDVFLGIKVPVMRSVIKKYDVTLPEIETLLKSEIHEYRYCAILALIKKYQKGQGTPYQKELFDFTLRHTARINNWDLVDTAAPSLIGSYLLDKDKSVLYSLAKSKNLWERRIAIVSTYAFIRKGWYEETLKIAELLLHDKHDLMHKAVGWMLREVGKRDLDVAESFLKKFHKIMPRTMLRYALERFETEKKECYMKG